MLYAERQKKLGRDSSRAHDRAEDLLTSTAFQLLRYLPLTVGLLGVLARVRSVRWESGRIVVGTNRPQWLVCDGVDEFKLDFWPRWPGAGVPDVVVQLLKHNVELARFVIEVKLDSPKSPRAGAPTDEIEANAEERRRPDQLWDYYDRLKQEPVTLPRGLIYLTAHPMPPLDELRESLECCTSARMGDWLGWLSWRDVWAAMREADPKHLPAHDLAGILAEKGFKAFDGYHGIPPAAPLIPTRFFHPWFSTRIDWSRPAGSQSFWEGRRNKK